MNIECVILEGSGDTIVVTLNKLVRSSCGKLGWWNTAQCDGHSTIRRAYANSLEWKPDLPIISKVKKQYFQDGEHPPRYLFEYIPSELERAYARLARRNYKTQHRPNVRSTDLQAHEN